MRQFSWWLDSINSQFMQQALVQAEQAFFEQEIPIGAVIVDRVSNQVIARAYNMVEQGCSPTAHAEMIAISRACQHLKTKNLADCDIYITLEPCTMCSMAISLARIGRLFYAAEDLKQGAVENGLRYFTSPACFSRPEIYPGLKSQAAKQLIKQFFGKIRKDRL